MSWLKAAISVAEALVEAGIGGQFEKDLALEGLEFLKDHADDLEILGRIAFKKGLIHRSAGDIIPAKSWAERASIRRQAQERAILAKEQSDAAWNFLEQIGLGALRAALPFILAAL